MKIVLLTGQSFRHYYAAQRLSSAGDQILVISCASGMNPATSGAHGAVDSELVDWFQQRAIVEEQYFRKFGFSGKKLYTCPVSEIDLNSNYVADLVKDFNPDIVVVYGTPIIKGRLISICPHIINVHLGISPYYNGAGTNWWPMYNNEYDLVGVTIHHLDSGVDTGNILGQCRALISSTDGPHDIGNKTIIAGFDLLCEILNHYREKVTLPDGVKQWSVEDRPVYRMKNFTSKKLSELLSRIKSGEIKRFVSSGFQNDFPMVEFSEGDSKLVSSILLAPMAPSS